MTNGNDKTKNKPNQGKRNDGKSEINEGRLIPVEKPIKKPGKTDK